MDFCTGTCAKIDQVDLVPLAEDLGVTYFGVGEGSLLLSDPYQYLALAAAHTSTISLGAMVTNPLTRIAPVTPNSMATVNALASGRTFLGIGTLLLTGVATNFSVEGTARAASDLGYRVMVVDDACAAVSPEMHAAALGSLGLLAEIVTIDDVLAALPSAVTAVDAS